MFLLQESKNIIDLLIRFLEVVIWPGTILVIIAMFRSQFKNAMGRLGSIEASATGVSMSFEPKLDKAKQLFNDLKPQAVSKRVVSIAKAEEVVGTPMEQVVRMRNELTSTLRELAQEANLEITGKTGRQLCTDLERSGVISGDNGKLMQAILEVLNAANANISQDQVNEIKAMIDAI